MNTLKSYEKELAFQADRRKATTEFIKIISDLWYDKSIEVVLFKNQIIDKNVSDIINLHEYAGEFVQKPISIFDSVEILRAINDISLPPSKLDIGKLTYEYHSDTQENYQDVKAFVIDKLKGASSSREIQPKDVILYGFGRIGRLLARELMAKTGKGNQLRLRAIVTRGETNPAKEGDLAEDGFGTRPVQRDGGGRFQPTGTCNKWHNRSYDQCLRAK